MAIAVDLMVLSIVLLFVFLGYKRGLVKVAFKLCTFFIAIILAFMLYTPVAKIVIENTNIDETIETKITDKILPEGKTETDEVDLSESLPAIILKNSENTVQSIAKSCSNTLIETACLVLIFIITKIVLKFVTALADLIAKLPILKQFNEVGGILYGIVKALLIVYVILAIVFFVVYITGNTAVSEAISGSYITKFFYEHNLILNIIFK